jgi:hypothetical protein
MDTAAQQSQDLHSNPESSLVEEAPHFETRSCVSENTTLTNIPEDTEARNDCADEGQQQFIRRTDRALLLRIIFYLYLWYSFLLEAEKTPVPSKARRIR